MHKLVFPARISLFAVVTGASASPAQVPIVLVHGAWKALLVLLAMTRAASPVPQCRSIKHETLRPLRRMLELSCSPMMLRQQ